MWLWGRHATQHVGGGAGHWGHSGSGGDWRLGIPQLADVRLLKMGSQTQGSETWGVFEPLSPELTFIEHSLGARYSSEHCMQFNPFFATLPKKVGSVTIPAYR